MSIDTKNDQVK